jgi:hypothetical protein
MSQTLGQKRVKAEFNPAKSDLVSQIKDKSAELIDLVEKMRIHEVEGAYISSEKHRVISIAQTSYEEAAMWAVKANFTE